jgi:predicted nucleic acid-binding protein
VKVLVDTCVWSAVLRYKTPDAKAIQKIKDLIADGRVVMIGVIRQEILSGVALPGQFSKLKDILAAFEDIPLKSEHFVKAAEFCNLCRSKGVQGSAIDFLICAVAYMENLAIFTNDKDFEHYRRYLSIKLL